MELQLLISIIKSSWEETMLIKSITFNKLQPPHFV
jgi:hypothetical protein